MFDRLKPYAATLSRVVLNSYDYFVIFFLLMFYLVRNRSGTFLSYRINRFVECQGACSAFWVLVCCRQGGLCGWVLAYDVDGWRESQGDGGGDDLFHGWVDGGRGDGG